MELIKRLSLILLLLCTTSSLWSNGGLQFKGKLRILRPTTLQVKDLNGNLVLTCSISQNGVFETEKKEIQPDVYTLCIGKTEQNIYFENTSHIDSCFHADDTINYNIYTKYIRKKYCNDSSMSSNKNS